MVCVCHNYNYFTLKHNKRSYGEQLKVLSLIFFVVHGVRISHKGRVWFGSVNTHKWHAQTVHLLMAPIGCSID